MNVITVSRKYGAGGYRGRPPPCRSARLGREAARQALTRGNAVLVGRGTGQLVADMANVLHMRLVAPKDWRTRRMAAQEGWTFEQAQARCTTEDRNRDRFLRYFFGVAPTDHR